MSKQLNNFVVFGIIFPDCCSLTQLKIDVNISLHFRNASSWAGKDEERTPKGTN
jgi:hypothetical protein